MIFIRASTFVNTAVGHSDPNTGKDYQGIQYYPTISLPAVTGFDFSRVSDNSFLLVSNTRRTTNLDAYTPL
jgi:hypothetical protein